MYWHQLDSNILDHKDLEQDLHCSKCNLLDRVHNRQDLHHTYLSERLHFHMEKDQMFLDNSNGQVDIDLRPKQIE